MWWVSPTLLSLIPIPLKIGIQKALGYLYVCYSKYLQLFAGMTITLQSRQA